jgi:uncharacterized damage-inducible protein DinB
MLADGTVNKLNSALDFFLDGIEYLEETDSTYVPKEGMFSVAQQVAHVAQMVEWFHAGMFTGKFNKDFDTLENEVREVNSLSDAKMWLEKSVQSLCDKISKSSDEELRERLPPGPIMGGVPRYIVVGAIADHCAHHRGSLAVYARLLSKL